MPVRIFEPPLLAGTRVSAGFQANESAMRISCLTVGSVVSLCAMADSTKWRSDEGRVLRKYAATLRSISSKLAKLI